MSAWARAVGEVPGVFLEGNQEGIMRREFEGGAGGGRSHMGKSNVAVI